MQYISTRGQAPNLSFDDALMAGLARDGGLYIPKTLPHFSYKDWQKMRCLPYQELATKIMQSLAGTDSILNAYFYDYYCQAYRHFDHHAIVPLTQYHHHHYILELFHGNSYAFKDMALQPLGLFFDHLLKARKQRKTIIGATSGDTGSAAMEAFKNCDSVDVFILFPKGRVSNIQQRQMTTINKAHMHAIAIDGSFDDCQDLVKAVFNDHHFCDEVNLGAVNSINWGRIASQIIYYCYAALQLGAPERNNIAFCVPSGNFGNIYAGYCAYKMGLPIKKLISASNHNDILYRFFNYNDMRLEDVTPSYSPSMDIQISSNFERLLYELCDNDGQKTCDYINQLRQSGQMHLDDMMFQQCQNLFAGTKCNDDETLSIIKKIYDETGDIIDPHTAIGIAGGCEFLDNAEQEITMVTLATAHPAKFNNIVEKALGFLPDLPKNLHDLLDRKEYYHDMTNDTALLKQYIKDNMTQIT